MITIYFQYPVFVGFCTEIVPTVSFSSLNMYRGGLLSSPSSLHWYESSKQLSSHFAWSSENLCLTAVRLKSSLKRVSLVAVERKDQF